MFTFLVILILIIAILLILAVLAQNSQKEGLGNPLSETGAGQLIGVRKTGDLLEQMTWGMIVTLLGLTLFTESFLDRTGQPGYLPTSPNVQRAQEQQELTAPASPQDELLPEEDATPDQK